MLEDNLIRAKLQQWPPSLGLCSPQSSKDMNVGKVFPSILYESFQHHGNQSEMRELSAQSQPYFSTFWAKEHSVFRIGTFHLVLTAFGEYFETSTHGSEVGRPNPLSRASEFKQHVTVHQYYISAKGIFSSVIQKNISHGCLFYRIKGDREGTQWCMLDRFVLSSVMIGWIDLKHLSSF